MKKINYLVIVLLIISNTAFSAHLKNIPKTVYQPNGEIIECFASGDEFFNYLHDADGYTIIQGSDGFYYYGIRKGEYVIPSEFLVNKVDPSSVGLKKYAKISKRAYYEKVQRFNKNVVKRDAPTTGTINNLNIFIRFADEDEFTEPRSFFDVSFNAEDTFSLKNYYNEVSYNTLEVLTTHYPSTENDINISYQDSHPRAYYKPSNNGANPEGYEEWEVSEREHMLLKNAIEYVESQIPEELEIDADGDGYVDNVGFMVYGNVGAWADLLWPHRWSLYSYNVTIHGKNVYDYMFMLNDPTYNDVGTLCHEFFHVLGAPDLYHYYNDVAPTPVGGWDIMESSGKYPPSMCMFMKYKYGKWIDEIPEISESGDYTLYPISSTDQNIFKIASPYSFNEYFVIDYRKKEGMYESYTPGTWSGIVAYRINSNAHGNAGGPPDEVYVYRPYGTINVTGQISNAPLCAESGRTEINDDTNPYSFLYNNGNGGEGGLNISNIGEAGDSITFHVEILKLIPPYNLSYVAGDGYIELNWIKPYTTNPDSYNVYRNDEVIANTATLEFTDNTVVNDTEYAYNVTAVYVGDPDGESEATNTVIVTPQAPMTLPYSIDFENGNESWMVGNTIESWQWGNNESFGFAWLTGNDSYYLGINSTTAGPNTNVKGFAITPLLNLNEYNFVNISFDYAFQSWQGNDELILKYRVSPNHPFINLLEMETSNTWKNISIDLPAGVIDDGVQLAFYYNDNMVFGYGAAIDNINITIESEASAASFEANLTEVCENELLVVSNNSTGTNHEYLWDFGEGAIPGTSNEFGPHEIYYNSEGYKTIRLTIDNNETEVMSDYIFVDYIPNASINFSVDGPSVNFITPTVAESYFWDFGDGVTSNEQNHTHSYEITGTYLVKLTITNHCGEDSDSINISVVVDDIADLSIENSILIYPNPNSGNFTINLNSSGILISCIDIYDLSGKIIYSEKPVNKTSEIALQNIEAGIYTVKMSSDKGIVYKKILVK
ncbi:M6 family metalloprotease domain-containing protein [Bacteroidota bacterium]